MQCLLLPFVDYEVIEENYLIFKYILTLWSIVHIFKCLKSIFLVFVYCIKNILSIFLFCLSTKNTTEISDRFLSSDSDTDIIADIFHYLALLFCLSL